VTFGEEKMKTRGNILTGLLSAACLLPSVAQAGPYDGPDTWSSTFPFCWVIGLVLWVGPTILVLSGVAAGVHKWKRKGISFLLLLRTFAVSLVGLLLIYTLVLAVLFAFTANFEPMN
jgi:hypothetical protein